MRRELIVFLVILAVLLVVGLFVRSLMLNIAVGQIKSAFPDCIVSVGSVEFRNIDMLAVTNIEVRKGDALCYRIRSAEINFSLLSVFTRMVPKITVKNGYIIFNSLDKRLKEVIEYPALKPGKGFIARSIVVSNLMLAVNTADWQLTAWADGDITMNRDVVYKANIKLGDLNLAFLAKGLNAAEKVDLSGRLNGNLSLQGENLKIAAIKGDFATAAPGGTLVIKDEEFLKKLAENTKQPLSVIEEGFKDYNFTMGTLRISRDAESIFFHILLDGTKGERDLTIALHGF